MKHLCVTGLALALLIPAISFAERSADSSGRPITLAQNHAGQMDTDGILSPGERPNPNIDYDKAQRHEERHGDERVDNPYNDRLAHEDREIKRDERDEDRVERERRIEREEHSHSWWPW